LPPSPPRGPVARRNGAREQTREDALVRSIRSLLFLLWGLGWVIVPVTLHQLHASRLIPIIMFSSLAAIFVLVWHKGALIRAILRRWFATEGDAERGQRIAITEEPRQVRVHATELRPEEIVGDTELGVGERQRRRRAL
jgi:hypothetical protein